MAEDWNNINRNRSWKPKKDIVRTLCGHISLEIYVRTMSALCPHNISLVRHISFVRYCADIYLQGYMFALYPSSVFSSSFHISRIFQNPFFSHVSHETMKKACIEYRWTKNPINSQFDLKPCFYCLYLNKTQKWVLKFEIGFSQWFYRVTHNPC